MANASPRLASSLAGISRVVLGIFCLTLSDAMAKSLGDRYSPIQILFLRALIATPVVLILVSGLSGRQALRTRHLTVHFVRGVINVLSASCFYLGLRYLPLAENTAIAFAAPLFVTALSVLFFKENVDRARWFAVVLGFVGVLVIVRPGSASFQLAALLPLVTAFLYAVMMITAQAIGKDEGMLTTMFYIVLTQLVCSAIVIPWFWHTPQIDDLPFFVGVALFSTLGLTLITQGFRIGPASVLAPFDYTGLLWATLLGALFWQEIPQLSAAIGALLIVGSGLYIALREMRR